MSDDMPSLARLDFFGELDPKRIAEIDSLCQWRHYERNDIILGASGGAEDAYFLVGGEARVAFVLEGGEEIKVATIGPYDVIGSISAIDEEPRSASVIASSRSLVAQMPRKAFLEILRAEPGVALRLLHRFAGIIRSLNSRVRDLSMLTPQQRLYGEMLRMARPSDGHGGPLAIGDMPNHDALAAWAHTTPDVVAFAIGSLARRGIVERKHKTLYIRDPDALRDLAGNRLPSA